MRRNGEKNILYLECDSGISGDMTVAALLDLGADADVLRKSLDSLPVEGFEIEIRRVNKAGLDVCDFHVKLDSRYENHDHDMEYLYGHIQETDSHLHHGQHHTDHGCQEHSHAEHTHHHEHRGLPEILEILRNSSLSDEARATAEKIFTVLAQAESKAHGIPVEQVHFHEVGAVDSIVDIAAVAVCLDNLHITDVIVPFLCEGKGSVRCQHGILPVPVPAVVNIVQAHHIPLKITNTEGELVTPTGAAIVAAVSTSSVLPEQFTIDRIGIGAGKRQYEKPSLLRAMLISDISRQEEKDKIYKLETNIDDCTGEALGFVMDKLFEAGAREVNFSPVFMKKNRPAYQLNILCEKEKIPLLEQIVFRETTTIGIRRVAMERTVLKRELETVNSTYGPLCIKRCILPDGSRRCYPEYDSVAMLAEKNELSFQEMMEAAKQIAESAGLKE